MAFEAYTATDTDDRSDGVDRPIHETTDRIVIDQKHADEMREALARNQAIKTQAWRRSPNYYEQMTAFNGYG